MRIQHFNAALSLTGFTVIGVTLACLGAFKVVPDALWASALCSAVIVPAIIYLAKLWSRHYYLRKTLDAYEMAGLPVTNAEMYVTRDMKVILRDEPALYAAIIHYSHAQRFNGYAMCDQAAPAFAGQGFTAAAGGRMVALVEVLLPHLEHLPASERRYLVTRTVESIRAHGAGATLTYMDALGPDAAFSALDADIALEYAQTVVA